MKLWCLLAASSLLAQDYPQWRGPNRDGSVIGFVSPKAWPEKLTLHWKVEVGEGYATPLVIGNRVYAFTRREGKEVMTALDAASGKVVWQTGYPALYQMAPATAKHGSGPKATPLFHSGKLFTLGVSGIMSAFDAANGNLIWQKPVAGEHPYFGAAVSPVGSGDLVMVHPGNYRPLTAYDANSGELRWTAKGGGTFASPVVTVLGGTRQVVTMTAAGVASFSVTDGAPLWEHPWPSNMQSIAPVIYGETVIVGGYDKGVAALKPVLREGKWTVDVVWESNDVSMWMSNPVIFADQLLGLSRRASGQFFALDPKTGKTLWLGSPREAANAAIVKAGDVLFLLKDDGELLVARSGAKGLEILKRYTVSESATWAQPAISGNLVFVKNMSHLLLLTLDL